MSWRVVAEGDQHRAFVVDNLIVELDGPLLELVLFALARYTAIAPLGIPFELCLRSLAACEHIAPSLRDRRRNRIQPGPHSTAYALGILDNLLEERGFEHLCVVWEEFVEPELVRVKNLPRDPGEHDRRRL